MAKTPAEIGKASRTKGIRAELDLARYLRNWWPQAERMVATGFRSGKHVSEDVGDIRGTPGVVWQIKAVTDISDAQIVTFLDATESQAVAAGADYGILVQRRLGKADPGNWWAWLPIGDLGQLATRDLGSPLRRSDLIIPVRLQLQHVVALLLNAGYGQAEVA